MSVNEALKQHDAVLVTFEGICCLSDGSPVEIRKALWDRDVMRVGVLKTVEGAVTFHSNEEHARSYEEVAIRGTPTRISVYNAAEDTVTGQLVTFRLTDIRAK